MSPESRKRYRASQSELANRSTRGFRKKGARGAGRERNPSAPATIALEGILGADHGLSRVYPDRWVCDPAPAASCR